MSELALKLIAENKKTRATFLDLGNCGLTEVPDEIGELVWLEELSFSKFWWNDSGEWQDSQNQGEKNSFNQLSLALEQLKNLKKLWLHDNEKLIDIKHIANLINLQRLYISNTQINNLNSLINLNALQTLSIHNTQITDINSLANLTALQRLYIFNTKVKNLSSLAKLSVLWRLDIHNTEVSDLSPLVHLKSLQELNISKTSVNDLSPLRGLTALEELSINNTQVSDLSPLRSLIIRKELKINAFDCPLINPPIEIIKQGREAIINYFREMDAQGGDHLYEAKLLLVGEGGAGKTSLLRRLYQTEKPLPDENDSTKGIEIYRHDFSLSNGRTFRLNVWDFGGQEIYHATHQFFLTQRSLYVLLDDTRKDHKTVHDEQFKYWLEAVDLLSGHSPVLIFQNEKSGRSKDIDFAGIKGKFPNVEACYSGDLQHANASDKLKLAIEFFAQNLPHIGEALPAQWIAIRADIEQRATEKATMPVQDYFDLYAKHLLFDAQKALWLSRYLHDLGVFLHYQDHELLRRIVVLQNDWATEAVFALLDDEQVKKQFGRFTVSDCQRLWRAARYAGLDLELRALMEKFELCYELRDSQPKAWLAPQLLPPSKPTELTGWEQTGDLILRYRYEFLPKGMINRLMVRQHRFVPRPDTAWLTGVLFERDGSQVLVEIPQKGGEIQLRARGLERKELLSVIANELEALNETFKGLPEKVVKLIPCCCRRCLKQSEPEFFAQQRLLQRKKDGKLTIECPSSYEDVSVLELLDGVQMNKLPNWSKEDTTMQDAMKIFISYSKHDNAHKETLLKHLAGLRDKIITWNDRDILAGEEWDKSIKDELHKADVVLYLVSADSIATDYIQQVELPLIEQRCLDKECTLIPIIVRACDWEEQGFAKYNVLPEKGKTIKSWADEDEAWLSVIKGIKRVVNAFTSAKSS